MTMMDAAIIENLERQQHLLVAEAERLKQEKGGLFLLHAEEGYECVTLAAVDTSKGLYVHPQGAMGIIEQQQGRWVSWEETRNMAMTRFGGHLPKAASLSSIVDAVKQHQNLGELTHFHEATLLEGIRQGVKQGMTCQQCGPTLVTLGSMDAAVTSDLPGALPSFLALTSPSPPSVPASTSSLLPVWKSDLNQDLCLAARSEPHPCDALHAAFRQLHTPGAPSHQTLVLLGSASGLADTKTHILQALFEHYRRPAPQLVKRISTAVSLLSTLLVLDDAALLSSPMEIKFFVKLQQQQQQQQSMKDETMDTPSTPGGAIAAAATAGAAAGFEGKLVGAELDVFLIERDPAKYDSLRDALASPQSVQTLGLEGLGLGGREGGIGESSGGGGGGMMGGMGNPPPSFSVGAPIDGTSLSATALGDLDMGDLSSSLSSSLSGSNHSIFPGSAHPLCRQGEHKGSMTFESLLQSFTDIGLSVANATRILRAMAASIILSKASVPLALPLYRAFDFLGFPAKLTKTAIQRVGSAERDLKQLAREAFTLAIQDLVGLLNSAMAVVPSFSPSSLSCASEKIGTLSVLTIPSPTLSNNLGRFSDLAAALGVIHTMTYIGPRIVQAYGKKEGGEKAEQEEGAGAISSTEEGEGSSNSSSSSNNNRNNNNGPPSVLMTTVDEVNSTADSMYGLAEAVNRSTLARVAESKVERELKASLKLGKADDVTLPWGKTLLAKPLIRLNAAMLPPRLAEMVGCTKRASGADSATVLDGLVAWIDKAVGKEEGEKKREVRDGEKMMNPATIEEVEEEEEQVMVEEGVKEEWGRKEGERMENVTGAGDLKGEVGTTFPTFTSVKQNEDNAASTVDKSRAFHLVCALKTNSSPTTFDGMKVVHQIRLYQLHYLAQGIGFVGPSATPTFSADFISQRILSGGDGGPGAHGGNPLLMGKNQQLFPGLTSVTQSRLAAYVSHAGNNGSRREAPMSPGRIGRHFERHGGPPGGGNGHTHAAAASAVMSGLSEAFAGRGGGGGMSHSSIAPNMGGRARLSAKDSTLALGHGRPHPHHAHPHAPAALKTLQEECWALRRRNEELGAMNTELLQLVVGEKHEVFSSPNTVGAGKRAGALTSPQTQAQVSQLSTLIHETVEKFTKVIWDTFGFDVRKEGVASLRRLRAEIVSHLDTLIAQEDILENVKSGFGSGGVSGSIGGIGTLGGAPGMGPGELPHLPAMPPLQHHRDAGVSGHHHGGHHNQYHNNNNHHKAYQHQQHQLQQEQYPYSHSLHHNAHHHVPPHHLAAPNHHHKQHHHHTSPFSLPNGEDMFY
ncbi:hypothetical protein VYU27_008447 [Nannochloropsis oceanica]